MISETPVTNLNDQWKFGQKHISLTRP